MFRKLLALAALATAAHADIKVTTKITSGPLPSVSTKYIQGRNWRLEYQNSSGPRRASICNIDMQRALDIDLDAKQYTVARLNPNGHVVYGGVPRIEIRPSGNTTRVFIETVDTAERQMMFGHMARHVVISERRVPETGSSLEERRIDGWYIDLPQAYPEGQPRRDGGAMLVAVDTHAPVLLDKIELHRTGSTENGFALHEVVTMPSGSITTEVIELSEAPLDSKLFRPPDGFQRVLQLPGEYSSFQMRAKLVWEWLEDAVHSW